MFARAVKKSLAMCIGKKKKGHRSASVLTFSQFEIWGQGFLVSRLQKELPFGDISKEQLDSDAQLMHGMAESER